MKTPVISGFEHFQGAQWAWPGRPQALFNCHAQFRRDFQLKAVPRRAPFFITVDQAYMLYVNGQYVARGPARGYQGSWPFDEVDLAGHLKKGHNWLSIRAYNAGFSTFQYIHEREMGLLCNGRIGEAELASGSQWLCRLSPAHKVHTARLSIQLNFQEHVDTQRDDETWLYSARFDRTGWTAPRCRPLGGMPWHSLEPRGIPHLGNCVLPYSSLRTMAGGECGADWRNWINLSWGFRDEAARMKWQPAPAGRVVRGGLQLVLPTTGPERLVAMVADLGQLGIGTLMVEAQSAQTGQTVDFFFAESLYENGAPAVPGPGQASEASMSARLSLRAGRTWHEFFQMMGHRYLVAIARGTSCPIKLKLALRQTSYPFEIRGRFASSDPVLNDIYRISVRTQEVCSLDAYVDTPWREQAQWWGDARVQAWNTFHLSGDTRLLVRGIRSLARQEAPNGLTYGHAPTSSHHCVLPDFSLIWVLTIWDYYYQTGDVSLFVEQWLRIQRLLGYFTGEGRGSNGLLRFDRRYWLFLDWCDLYKQGTPTLLNLWYLLTLQRLVLLAGVARMPKERTFLQDLYNRQERLITAKLFDRARGLVRDGITPEGKPVDTYAIHNQTLAMLCGLKPACHDRMVRSILLPYLRGQDVAGPKPSSYWVTYVYGLMQRLGYGKDVVAHIRQHWTPMVRTGGTWEMFSYDGINSTTSHAWSAHPIYHLPGILAGITQAEVGWKSICFAPVLDAAGVDHVAATVPSPLGDIKSSWQRHADHVAVELALPKAMKAHVELPGQRPRVATGRNRWRLVLPCPC